VNNMTFMELMNKGGWVMWIMFFASILIFTFLLERIWAFSKVGGASTGLIERVKQYVRQGQIKEAIALCTQNNKNFTFHVLEVALHAAGFPREEMESIFAMYRMKMAALLNKRLAIFGTFAFIGPLLGLFGTVMGVIRAFSDLALSGSGGPTIVAAGIAESLIATAAGIFVAVSASLMYNFFTSLMRARMQQYDLLTQEVAILVYTGNNKGR
jgi:biopolymer transport protein ExbB